MVNQNIAVNEEDNGKRKFSTVNNWKIQCIVQFIRYDNTLLFFFLRLI